jgi:hypothetical protein
MTFPILGGNGAVAGAFSIDNSLRFNDDDSAYLTRTNSAGNRKTWTWSSWVKRCDIPTSGSQQFIFTSNNASNYSSMFFDESTNRFNFYNYSGGYVDRLETNAVYRDVSAWYHFFIKHDSTQSTEADRLELYVNGLKVTSFATANYPTLNYDSYMNVSGYNNIIGRQQVGDSALFDGYIAETHFIDGTAKAPTDFGEFDEDSGIWKPKAYDGSYGTNGFYLDFENSGSLGADQSGNGNNFTATNLASTDQTTDTPTNNFATINALANQFQPATLSEGNTRVDFDNGVNTKYNISTIGVSSGKWYCEVKAVTIPDYAEIGIASRPCAVADDDKLTRAQYNYGYASEDGNVKSNNGSGASYGDTYDDGDIIGIILDLDNNKIYFSKNGTVQNSGDPTSGATGTGAISIQAPSGTPDGVYYFAGGDNRNNFDTRMDFNFGNPAFSITSGNSDGNGYGNFEYAPPSGYLALCTQNLATALSPTIDDGSAYFQTATYSGTGSSLSVVNDGNSDLQPDWIWLKCRTRDENHSVHDSTRGVDNFLASNQTNAEGTETDRLESFNTDGFTVNGGDDRVNISGATYVAWQWKANGGTTSSNTDGSITSTVQANTTAGFSIVTYTGNRTAGATVGHGLGVAPSMVIAKCRTASAGFPVFHASLGGSNFVRLNESSASASNSVMWNNTAPSSTVVTLGGGDETNNDTGGSIMYCFAEIEGYSSINSYTGNGSTDGTFVYTGFRPALVIVKKYSAGENWNMTDSTRSPFNVCQAGLSPSTSSAEDTSNGVRIDLLSNGFKARDTAGQYNDNGASYIYMAFAEHPFVDSNGVPVTAR